MRLIELLEASKREKARRAKQSAQSKRAAASDLDDANSAPKKRKKGIPANVPNKRNYITNTPLRQQQAAFAGSEFDDFRDAPDENEGKGVVLRFHVAKHPKTGIPVLYGYWAHDYAPDFNDCKNLGSTELVGALYSEGTVELIRKLVDKEHAVNVLIDKPISTQFPAEVKKLGKWATSKARDKEFNGGLNFEIDDTTVQQSEPKKIVTVPTADVRIPNVQQLEQQIMIQIRKDPDLSARFTAADHSTRTAALKAGVVDLHKFKDIATAVDTVDVALV